ncbi:MAG: FGGY family carbohydrate kinase [Patescibacteria group bacterium]
MSEQKLIKYMGFDGSTTALSVVGRTVDGEEVFATTLMLGGMKWHEQPAFDLALLPTMFLTVLQKLQSMGYGFAKDGAASLSWRQHDMVIMLSGGYCLPALSWQCNAATEQVKQLQRMGAEQVVGRIDPRFILSKYLWAIKQDPAMFLSIKKVMTTEDYIAAKLTGAYRLSTSDALSNGLLRQSDKTLAYKVLQQAGLNPAWFPPVVQSGTIVGDVLDFEYGDFWGPIKRLLNGWKVVAGLGDNHASAVGCGLADEEMIVVSAGSSGTVVRCCDPSLPIKGKAAAFEYYQKRLLLMMLPDCAIWYNRFVQTYGKGKSLNDLNALALKAEQEKWREMIIEQVEDGHGGWKEVYPRGWNKLSIAAKVASIQHSIAGELVYLVRELCEEMPGIKIEKVILTGGLSRSLFFQKAIKSHLAWLFLPLFVTAQTGPAAFKSAARGALINAMVGVGAYPDLQAAIAELCPIKPYQEE